MKPLYTAGSTDFTNNRVHAQTVTQGVKTKIGTMCVEQVIRAWGKPSKPIQLASEIGLLERESVSVPPGNVVTGASAAAWLFFKKPLAY